MKISFSTLGCPDWRFKEIIAAAKDLGYDGIELRGIGKEIYVPKARPFLPERIESTKKELLEKALEVPCVTSSCCLHKDQPEYSLQEGKEYIDLAQKLGAPYIRVLGDSDPQPQGQVDQEQVARLMKELGDYAQDRNVTVLIETNGVYADSHVMLELMQQLNHPSTAVLWDVHHPYRFMEESLRETFSRLGPYIRHVHLKDSRLEGDRIRYCLIGQGDLPIQEALDLLAESGYKGHISLEWVKRWYYDLEEPGIVFSHFINTIKQMI